MRAPSPLDLQSIWDNSAQLKEWTLDQLHLADLATGHPVDDPRRALNLQMIVEDRETNRLLADALRHTKRRGGDHYYQLMTESPELAMYLRDKRGRPIGYAASLQS
jgi:hypothetical protein